MKSGYQFSFAKKRWSRSDLTQEFEPIFRVHRDRRGVPMIPKGYSIIKSPTKILATDLACFKIEYTTALSEVDGFWCQRYGLPWRFSGGIVIIRKNLKTIPKKVAIIKPGEEE